MKLYYELADWWHFLSAPDEYAEEANLFQGIIEKYRSDVVQVLEMGSGGGNNAYHFKKFYKMTLSDLSPEMIRVSRQLNPECQHIIADMRHISLGRTFDLVFIHDAIMHLTTEADLLLVFERAAAHLPKDGILFIVPDYFKETFTPYTNHGGHDEARRGLRYLEWTYDRDPTDTLAETEYVYILKEMENVRIEHETMMGGIFSQAVWEVLLQQAGFKVYFETINHSELESNAYIGIVAIKQ